MPLSSTHFDLSTARGLHLRYADSDPDCIREETILLLHGTGSNAEAAFWALYPMLAMRHRVITFDFVDPIDPETERLPYYVEQASAVATACSQGQVHVVGYSFGAVIAATLSAQEPNLVASLTLVAGWMKTDTQQLLRNDVWRSLQDLPDACARFLLYTTYGEYFLNSKTAEELDALIATIGTGPDRGSKMAFNRTVDLSDSLDAITSPSLVVCCTQDLTAPPHHSRLLFGGIADARFVEITAGHGVIHERPSELFTIIDDFVTQPRRLPAGSHIVNGHA